MCSACGILQRGCDWIEGAGDDAAERDRLAERRRRMSLVNMMLEGSGVTLRSHGRLLILQSATGATRLVSDMAHVWRSADELGRSRIDPLEHDRLADAAGGAA